MVVVRVVVWVTVTGAGCAGELADVVGLGVGVGVTSEERAGLEDGEGTVYRLLLSHPPSAATNPATATATKTCSLIS